MTLRRLYGLREAVITVPDTDVPDLKKVVARAIKAGELSSDARAWFKRSAGSAKPTAGTGKPSEKPAPRQPASVSKTPSSWASWKQQAGDEAPPSPAPDQSKAGSGATPTPPVPEPKKARPAVKPPPVPAKKAEIPFIDVDPDDEFPQLAPPRPASVDLKGKPADDKMFKGLKKPRALSRIFGKYDTGDGPVMQPKNGALSRIFGKKGPEFDDNPYAMEPDGIDWATSTGDIDFAEPKPRPKPPRLSGPADDTMTGKDAIDDLDDFLRKNPPSGKRAVSTLKKDLDRSKVPMGSSPGLDALRDLNWDLKRAKGKR